MKTVIESGINCAAEMDTSQHYASEPARRDRESAANTRPCVTENSSPVLSVPYHTLTAMKTSHSETTYSKTLE